MTIKSNTALRADDDPVLAAIELTANAWQRFVTSCGREPKDADGSSPVYAKWQAAQDDISQDWDSAYTVMLATLPTTAGGAAALIDAFLQYERALGTELENVAPLLQSLLAYLEGGEAANPQRHSKVHRAELGIHAPAQRLLTRLGGPRCGSTVPIKWLA